MATLSSSSPRTTTTTTNGEKEVNGNNEKAMPGRYRGVAAALGPATFDCVRSAKVLVVGSGGIGCEVLKNLVLLGVEDVTTVDLDTIDVSNLNRQFLFRKRHVGRSKAEVARDACEAFNPLASLNAYRANVKEERFDLKWFSQFDAVINALDNVDARRHVNRMCLAADVPLIEAGTTGYLGQVFAVKKDDTACYECFPKPAKKVYPVCTIRATPDKPVHCVVWAKELLKLAFGKKEESVLYDDDESIEKPPYVQPVEKLRGVAASRRGEQEDTDTAVVSDALVALFVTEMERLDAMRKQKNSKDSNEEELSSKQSSLQKLDANALRSAAKNFATAPSQIKQTSDWDRTAWSIDQCAAEFAGAVTRLAERVRRDDTLIEFDKDDDDAMLFVCAATNLRASCYNIDTLSLYAAKGVAGNIVPAIATTNAIVAGLQVSQLVKLLRARKVSSPQRSIRETCSYVYARRDPAPRGGFLIQPTALDEPQPDCYVCRKATVTVGLSLASTTLGSFVEKVLQGNFNFVRPAVDAAESGLYDPDDERLAPNIKKPLANLPDVKDGAVLSATDFATDLELTVVLRHLDANHRLLARRENTDGDAVATSSSSALDDNDDPAALVFADFVLLSPDDVKKLDDELLSSEKQQHLAAAAAAAQPTGANKKKRALDDTQDNSNDDVVVVQRETVPNAKKAKQ